jgi:anti-anti-sigma factor
MPSAPSPLTIQVREREDVAILAVSGKLMGGPDLERIRTTIVGLVDRGTKKILLDFASVPWVNSAGVGLLLALVTGIPRSGAQIKFVHINERIRSILEVTRISSHVESYADEDAALASFAGS